MSSTETKLAPQAIRIRARTRPTTAINKINSDFGKPKSAKFECVPIDSLKATRKRLKKENAKQRLGLEASVKRFGALGRILVDENGYIIDGHVYWEVLKALGYAEVQVAVVDHLSEAEIQALTIALDRLSRLAEMDDEVAKAWVTNLYKVDPSLLHFTALAPPKIDALMVSGFKALRPPEAAPKVEAGADEPRFIVSREGDRFRFSDGSELICGNARDPNVLQVVVDGRVVRMLLTDNPYGEVSVKKTISGGHEEFADGADMTEAEAQMFFQDFLRAALPHVAKNCPVVMFRDHRVAVPMMLASRVVGLKHVDTLVYDRGQGSMGRIWRHRVEFIEVFCTGKKIETDNVQLGKHGRNRTSLIEAKSMASFGADRSIATDLHPTVKCETAMAELILDVTNPGDYVLDMFLGSGTTAVAAHRVNRRCIGVEIEPKFVDASVRRMQEVTGEPAIHVQSGLTFDELCAQRQAEGEA